MHMRPHPPVATDPKDRVIFTSEKVDPVVPSWIPSISMSKISRLYVVALVIWCSSTGLNAQTSNVIPFTSGPIPPCDTSIFTANVAGVGQLSAPGSGWWTQTLNGLMVNITTDHPEFLQITLTSPMGTTLLLSAFNGAGGQNYTSTYFGWTGPSITTGTAPFTNNFVPQGGSFSVFNGQWADGTWTITVVDTACVGGPNAGGGNPGTNGSGWNPGWFNGSSGNGGFVIYFDGPPPCWGGIPGNVVYLCPGETVDLVAYYESSWTGYQYSYFMPDGWTPIPDPTAVSATGYYGVQAIDPWGGCWYWADFVIYAVPEIDLGPDQVVDVCGSGVPVNLTTLFTLNGGEFPTWSFNGTVISNSAASNASNAGVYQLIAFNGGTCGDTALVTLNINSTSSLGVDETVSICPGSSIDLTALYNTAGLTSEWSFGGVSYATPLAASDAGVYTLIATTAAGCTDTASVTITVEVPPVLGGDQLLGVCSNATLDLTTVYTTTGLLTAWTSLGAPVANPSAISSAGIYQLIVANVAGCSDTALVTVSVMASPALGADHTVNACVGDAVDLTAEIITTGLTTTWTTSGVAVPDPSSVGANGSYTIVATNAMTCTDTANVTVVLSANPLIGPDQSVTECDGSVVDLTALYVTGVNATAWTVNGTSVNVPTTVVDGGVYTITVTNASGCSSTADVTLSFDPSPALGVDQMASICAGSAFDLTAVFSTSGLTSSWTISSAPVNDPTAVNITGSYQLVATNGFNCTDTAISVLTVNANPSLGADLSFTLCPWQSVDLGAVFPVAGMTATYSLDGANVDYPTAVADSGAYMVTVIDANGCMDEAMATVINVACLCEADFMHDAQCMQEPVHFTLVADSLVLGAHWDFGDAANASLGTDPIMNFTSAGDMLVTLQATLGCGVVTVQRTIHITDCSDSCRVWIPNAFTPNGDTYNDTWSWKTECVPEEFQVMVFNRWGEVIFTSEDPTSFWDGTYAGVESQVDVYVYRVGYRLPYQKHKDVIGHVTLVR